MLQYTTIAGQIIFPFRREQIPDFATGKIPTHIYTASS